jgi:lipid-A-disaccharide synthase
MKYFIVAGEASGDLHGSNLMKSLLAKDAEATFKFWGGDKMNSVGGEMDVHYKDLAFMGFIEVLKNLVTIIKLFKQCKASMLAFDADVVIFIDYPGFNLRMAKWAKNKGFKVVYYITPQIWAWHKSRVHLLGKYTDKCIVILPFEVAFFQKYGYNATYVGHPLLDAIRLFKPEIGFRQNFNAQKKVLALLPGSRKQEIKTMLPIMLEAVKNEAYTMLISAAPSIDAALYHDILTNQQITGDVHLIHNKTYDILSIADYALVSSGTATLETALFKVPQIVCYKGNKLSYMIAKNVVDLKFISLVNLIMDKMVVEELIQDTLTPTNILSALERLKNQQKSMISDYETLALKLGSFGASDKAATEVIHLIKP